MDTKMSFSEALDCLNNGYKITRAGWNGKRQYVVKASMVSCRINGELITDIKHENIGSDFLMFVGTSGYQCGWLASQSDMLAEDWEIFELMEV